MSRIERILDILESIFGSLANCHPMLNNVQAGLTEPHYDDSLMNRMEDPGAGAFSYHSRTITALRNIDAGHELFVK